MLLLEGRGTPGDVRAFGGASVATICCDSKVWSSRRVVVFQAFMFAWGQVFSSHPKMLEHRPVKQSTSSIQRPSAEARGSTGCRHERTLMGLPRPPTTLWVGCKGRGRSVLEQILGCSRGKMIYWPPGGCTTRVEEWTSVRTSCAICSNCMASGRTRAGDAALVGRADDSCCVAAHTTDTPRAVRTGEGATCEKTCDWPRRAAACTECSAVGIRAGDRKTVDSFLVR